ncbi:hypothetical protein [Kribbella catacumbae]|uniref:hypothetical protein n=1 Tax=Kribbella catacumbae TaxID=460086 RepID=UPI0012FAA298|nr:hypothetical protein [Kribbella catacumbae]
MRLPRRTTSRDSAQLRGGALLAVACTSALLLPACSNNAGTASSGTTTTPPGGSTTTPAKTTKAPETKQSPKLPGTKEFGLTEQQFADHVEKTQALITTCMSEAGFEYVPVDVKTVEAAQARVRHDPGMTRAQYKAKWGFAVSTRQDNPVRDTGLGPNLRIYNSLAPANKVAYNRTLFGEDPTADFVFTLDEEDFSSTGGCTRAAVTKVFTPVQVRGTYVNPKDVLVQADKRIVAARQAWSKCMKAEGYDYIEDQDEIIGEYEERLDKLLDGDDPDSLTGERAAALKKLHQDEIAVALADLDCQLKHSDKVFDQVETEVYGHPLE